jgi:hypothetical protein
MHFNGDLQLSKHLASLGLAVADSCQEAARAGNIYVEADNIYIGDLIEWESSNDLILKARSNIVFTQEGQIIVKGDASIYLKAGLEDPTESGVVRFEGTGPQLQFKGKGKAFIYYNPTIGGRAHKYHNPYPYLRHLKPPFSHTSYMLVNNIYDLQDINFFLHGNYALSRTIDASATQQWNNGAGFIPISKQLHGELMPFSGHFDGNGFSINNLFINAKDTNSVGLFGTIAGGLRSHVNIINLKLQNLNLHGNLYVGGVAGEAEYVNFVNIEFLDACHITGTAAVGGVVGRASGVMLKDINLKDTATNFVEATEFIGSFCGAIRDSMIHDTHHICTTKSKCVGYGLEITWE